jgi:hypothetical protein
MKALLTSKPKCHILGKKLHHVHVYDYPMVSRSKPDKFHPGSTEMIFGFIQCILVGTEIQAIFPSDPSPSMRGGIP